MPLLTRQPFKGLYVLFAIGATLMQMPMWALKYLFVRLRQHPNFSLKQAFHQRFIRKVLEITAAVQVDPGLTLKPGKEKERFIVIEPTKSSYYVGPLVSNDDINPATIGATWYPSPLSAGADMSRETIVLHMHGGAMVIGDGRTEASGFAAKQLLEHTGATHILKPQYRISTLPASKTSNPFPAALQDVLTSYLYVIHELQVPPSNIVISGDSAGGNLAIQLLHYLSEYGAKLELPNPRACWLFSPWISPATSDQNRVLENVYFHIDYLPVTFINWGRDAYSGTKGLSLLAHPYIETLGKPFKTTVPIWVNSGGVEVLFFDINKFANEMRGVEGNKIELDIEEDAPHDSLLLGNLNGFVAAAEKTATRAGAWLEALKKA